MFKAQHLFLLSILSLPIASHAVERKEVGNLVMEDIPTIPSDIKDSMTQYQNTRFAVLNGWRAHDGAAIISTRFAETTQIHVVSSPMGLRRQITFFDEPVGAVSVSPEEDSLLFTKDVGGSEYYQVFLMNLSNGEYKMVTDGQSRNGGALWSNDGSRFIYYSTKRNNIDWDLYVADLEDPENPRIVLDEGGTWFPVQWSPDDSRVLINRYVSINESYYYVLNVTTGSLQQLNTHDAPIGYGDAVWAPNGKGVFLTSDQDEEFQKLRYLDLDSGQQKVITNEIPWNIDELESSSEQIAFTSNENGASQLYLMDPTTLEYEKVDLPLGVVSRLRFSGDGRNLGLVLNAPTSPADVYSLDIETSQLSRWTASEVGGLNVDEFAEPKLIHYETFDRKDREIRKIPAFYYKPEGEGPFPVLVRIHGGPEGQSRPLFSWSTQYFVNESNYAVLVPNVRGSSGYGKSYLKLDNGFKREDSVKDIGMLLEWIAEQPELDQNRVAVYGGSYGGYMVLASMTNFNDSIACGVDVVGISNFVTFLQNTKGYRRDLRRPEYGDERDPKMREFLNRISPTNNAKNITKPLFVVQGLNDPRVPASESEQMVREIRENGQDVWYLLAKDEGHGFSKKANRDYYLNATSMFLDQCIGSDR
ncbi:MAG: S9 family peptidase [Pseudomonadota bacterium]